VTVDIKFEPGTSSKPPPEARLRSLQKYLGVSLPRDYIEFLRRSNGGVPIDKFFNLGSNEKVVERLLPLLADYKTDPLGDYDVEVVWSQIEGRLDDSLVPFAVLFAGDFLCFDSDAGDEPSVVLWDHERSRQNKPFTVPVAASFREFAAMLHS